MDYDINFEIEDKNKFHYFLKYCTNKKEFKDWLKYNHHTVSIK